MTLQEAKDQVAKKHHWDDWVSIRYTGMDEGMFEILNDEAAELYADDCRREGFNGGLMAERILNRDEIAGLKSRISDLVASLVDHEKAKAIWLDNNTIDTDEALKRIATDLGYAIEI